MYRNPPQWMDVSELPFSVMLLLEDIHLRLFPRDWPGSELGTALAGNPSVRDFFLTRLGKDADWMLKQLDSADSRGPEEVRVCEITVMKRICDWLVYVCNPEIYDTQPFLEWDDRELLDLADFTEARVLDVGSGTGRLLQPLLPCVHSAYALEPVAALRRFIRCKFHEHGKKLFVLDGTITDIPFEDSFFDIVLSGHVYGDEPERELAEMERVTAPGGKLILCPGNSDSDNTAHEHLVKSGCSWEPMKEPGDRVKRKYWKTLDQ